MKILQEEKVVEYHLGIDSVSSLAAPSMSSDHDKPIFKPEVEKYGQPDSQSFYRAPAC